MITGLDADMAVLASAKGGIGIEEVIGGVVKYLPPPKVLTPL